MFRDVFGPEGRLIEITSAEVQELAVEVIRAAEESFTIGDPELAYWWTGLRDEDDDGQWVWETSKMIVMSVKWFVLSHLIAGGTPVDFSFWHPSAATDHDGFNCMQLLSGTFYDGQWMTFECYDDFIDTHALCQLK